MKRNATKRMLAMLLLAFAGAALGSGHVSLPAEGYASADSIIHCESQVVSLAGFEKFEGGETTGYKQINLGSDSFIYFFTTPADPAHPAMLKITIHPMANPRQPKESDMAFFASYAGREADFKAWSKKVLFEFGRGFGTGVMKGG